jgi:rod shape-determining protein MreC
MYIVESTNKFSTNIKEIVNIHQENLALKKAIERFSLMEAEWSNTKAENQRLRSIVGFTTVQKSRPLTAHIISREPASWFQWIIIDKGRQDGIYINAPVLAWAGSKPAVMGRVEEVFINSAKVVLVTNVLSAMPAEARALPEDGLVEGQNSHYLKINYLMPDTKIKVGDEVVTSPLSSVFPPDILIGTISDFSSSDDEAFRSAVIKPAVNFNNLREAIVLIQENH